MAENILITGARAPVALDLARDFSQAGYSVFLADCSSAFMSKWSSVPQKFFHYASPVHDPEKFRSDIKSIVDALNPRLIIPTCEEVFHLSHPYLADSLKGKLFAPPLPVLKTLHNKATFNDLCLKSNIPAPETHIINCRDDLQTYQGTSQEWVFKPCYSRFGAQTLIRPPFEKLQTIRPSPQNPWIAQKFISGTEFSFYAVSHNGKLTAISPYQSSWRLKGGASYVFTPAFPEAAKQAKIIAETLAESLILSGQFSCDFIIDGHGTAWPIECNPRATSGLHLFTGHGDLARTITSGKHYKKTHAAPLKYMLPMMISHGMIKAIKEKEYRSWFLTLRTGSDVINSKNDRLPLLGSMIDTLIFLTQALRQNLSLAQVTTSNIEWNGDTLA